jgi:probable addiction module antidote protein
MLRSTTTPWDVVEHLRSEEDMALYLEAAFDDGDSALISAAIADIARARGMAELATKAGLDQQGQSEAGAHCEPDLATMLRVIKAVGLRLRVSVGR